MSGRIVLVATLTLAGFWGAARLLSAQDDSTTPAPDAPTIGTSVSPDYPEVSCSSADALACTDGVQLATDTHDRLASVLQLGTTWRFAVHIRIMTPDDPLLAKINREASAVFAQGDTMKIEAVAPSTDPNLREFIQRQYVTALLWEKFFAKTTTFDRNTHLDVVPIWLVEGLREWANDDPERTRERIVRRAVHNQMAPSLEEITGWHELSDDRLLGIWQRAFCFYLVDSITQKGPRRDDFQEWLEGFTSPNPAQAQYHFPTETAWQRELVDATSRSRQIIYSWDETQAELTEDQTLTFVTGKEKDAKVQTCSIFDVPAMPHTVPMFEAIKERIDVLTELELRAHASWNPIIELYRSALTALIQANNVTQAQKQLQEGREQFAAETDEHKKLIDYVNWFEVTKNYSEPSQFGSYFTTAKEMEQVQGDPAHRNPIRANLLQIESEL